MPTYQAPDFAVLQQSINQLDKQYTGKDRKRLNTIKSLQTLAKQCTSQTSQNILLGHVTLSLDDIASEYTITSPQQKILGLVPKGSTIDSLLNKTIGQQTMARFFFSTGSTLDGLLRAALHVSNQNQLDKYHKLIYLAALHAYAETTATDNALTQASNASLATAVADCKTEIDALEKKRFSATVVKQNFADIATKYTHRKNARVTSREALIALIRTVDKKLQSSNEAVTNYSFNNTIRYALVVYIMEELEAEYTTHSDLYDLCQETINLKHTNQLPILEKYNYYSALHAFLPKLNPHADEPCNWLASPIPNANQFLSDMTGKLLRKMSAAYEALENGHVYTTLDSLRTLINMAMTFGIGIAVGSFAGGLVTLSSEQKVFSRFIGSLARTHYGITAKIVAEQTAVAIEQAAVTAVVSTSIKKATSYIATVPGHAVYYTLSIPANIAVAIKKMLASPSEKKFHESIEFINTLISLPDTLIPKTTKENLQKIELYMPEITPQSQTLTAQPRLRRSMSI